MSRKKHTKNQGVTFRPPPSLPPQCIKGPPVRAMSLFGKRPKNQSTYKCKNKIFVRLLKDIETLGLENEAKVTAVIKQFIELLIKNPRYRFSEVGIDICHGESYAQMVEFIQTIIELAPKCSPAKREEIVHATNEYFNVMMSTDEESDREHGKETIEQCLDPKANKKKLIKNLKKLLDILNGNTRNTTPGHASINRSIGGSIDPQIVGYNQDGVPIVPERTIKIRQASEKLAMILELPCPEPKYNEQGKILSSTAVTIPAGTSVIILPSKPPVTPTECGLFSEKRSQSSPQQGLTTDSSSVSSSFLHS